MNKISVFLLVHLLAAAMLYGETASEQLRSTVLSALELFKTGSYSCELQLDHPNGTKETMKMLHVVSEQHGVMTRYGIDGYPVIERDGKLHWPVNGKDYVISLQGPKYNPLSGLWQAFEQLHALLEQIPGEYHQKPIKCDGKPGSRITVFFPKELTPEQWDTIHSLIPDATLEEFASLTMVFHVGKQNGFLHRMELYDAKGQRKDSIMSFSKVKVNPEWSLDDFTMPADLEPVEISTVKQYEKIFLAAAQKQPATQPESRRPRQSLRDFLLIHRAKIQSVIVVVLRLAGLLLLLGAGVIYFRRKRQ